ncbi:MAG: carboxypeptidase-like regulatory domain-containing protein [Deinococcales bacterium]
MAAALLASIVVLAGCGGPTIVTVEGTVVDQLQDPVPNATVLVDGHTTSTAADGTFSVANIQPPYDVAVSAPGALIVQDFQGLTGASPTLVDPGAQSLHHASIAGALGTDPFQSNEAGIALPTGASPAYGAAMVSNGAGPAFGPATVTFGGASNRSTTLYGLRALVDSSGIPTSFTGFGTLQVDLHDGDTLTGLTIPMAAVGNGTVSGHLDAPSGYSLTSQVFVLLVGGTSTGGIVGVPLAHATPTGTFSGQPVPVASEIRYGVAGRATDATGNVAMGWGGLASQPGASVAFELPSAATPTAPPDHATNVTSSTTFRWTALPNGIYIVRLTPTQSGTGPAIDIMTRNTSLTLPDLSAIGAAIPAGTAYTLTVLGAGPLASVDEAAGVHGLWNIELAFEVAFAGSGQPLLGPTTPGWLTASTSTTFTTAP